jgi:hypothetical protein
MQSRGGLINDILVMGVFIYLILLLRGIVKLGKDKQEKLNILIQRRGTLLKVLVYGGAVIFLLNILIDLFSPSK